MKKTIRRIEHSFGQFLAGLGFSMRTRLIMILVIVKVIPLILITLFAIFQIRHLAMELSDRANTLKVETHNALTRIGGVAVEDSVKALNEAVITKLEQTSTDVAMQIADFLYMRDKDILYIAELEQSEAAYRNFLKHKTRPVVKQREWVLAQDGKSWVPKQSLEHGPPALSSNAENDSNYQNRPADLWEKEERPLFLEMTYIDLAGNELVKVTSSQQMDSRRRNVSNRQNTYVKAETYFPELRNLKPGEIYVSDVIGAYVPSRYIGMYTPGNIAKSDLEYKPETEAYAGMENPLGKRFKGIIRWATPVVRGGRITGYVTFALDHDHIMEFVDHITPTDSRYVEMPSAHEGNYAFIWDYNCRNIAHPRHHSITGYDPETGEPQIPWLEDRIYNDWKASGLPYSQFIKNVPTFHEQSREKKLSPELQAQGLVGLDGRYLNNAPQCTGWFDLTKEGGSGSFLILWGGIWKPNAVATIPYYTGKYGNSRRGFGFVAVGAAQDDFQRPARETQGVLNEMIIETDRIMNTIVRDTDNVVSGNLVSTTAQLGILALITVAIVVCMAIWIASIFSSSITGLVDGITRFRAGERQFRFNATVKDEIGILSNSFDEMADSLVSSDHGPIVILDNDMKVLYANEIGLMAIGKEINEITGLPYSEISFYPIGSEYDPVAALHAGTETAVLYKPDLGCYFKGEASYMTDKNGKHLGYIVISTDVSDIMEQQQRLEQAMEEAKIANEHKGTFLARMSHEIRTPMNAIIGMTEIAKKKLVSNNYQLDDVLVNIRQIETSSQHLLGLLNDILDLSKIEAGKIELFLEENDLSKLATTVVDIIQPRCDQKNIVFEKNIDIPNDKAYKIDALRLRQVLINLLGNAVKFTPEKGKVTLDIIRKESTGGKARIDFAVRDTGIGISDSAIATLFDPYTQANNQIASKYGGTGLGLGISKNIVQMLGGDITVSSVLGEGSVFAFSLLLEETDAEKGEEITSENSAGRLIGKRALLVDDVEINRIIAMNLLEATGITIDEANDGIPAVKAFKDSPENTYDIIYMDVQMPEMNGYDAAKAIRAIDRPDAKTVPIIALTANAFKEDIDRALASGMNAHLSKPMDMEKTIEVTFKLLGVGPAKPSLLQLLEEKRKLLLDYASRATRNPK